MILPQITPADRSTALLTWTDQSDGTRSAGFSDGRTVATTEWVARDGDFCAWISSGFSFSYRLSITALGNGVESVIAESKIIGREEEIGIRSEGSHYYFEAKANRSGTWTFNVGPATLCALPINQNEGTTVPSSNGGPSGSSESATTGGGSAGAQSFALTVQAIPSSLPDYDRGDWRH